MGVSFGVALKWPVEELQFLFLIPAVKHGSGGVMIWTYFPATGPGHLLVTESAQWLSD